MVSITDMLYAYDAGQRVFGESYVHELISKASQMPKDVRWHFIGHLQSNKSKKLLLIENLDTIETLDSEKLADQLQLLLPQNRCLNVFIQVNVSREESK
jgi:PLP dependent protein